MIFLVTGCSSGIGRAIAEGAAAAGHYVFATARRPEQLADLAKPGSIETLPLDVTSPESAARAIAGVVARAGRLDVLVNNAGYGQMGTVEDISIEKWKAEFDVNVFGLIRVTQLALPHLRRSRGYIVNIGSIAGRISYPFGGAYCASKYAVEALTDALRLEVETFGVRVVLIEPGPITTKFKDRVETEIAPLLENSASPYHETYSRAYTAFRKETSRGALPPQAVARTVLKAVGRKRPATRYVLSAPARIVALARRFLPDTVLDAGMRRKFRGV